MGTKMTFEETLKYYKMGKTIYVKYQQGSCYYNPVNNNSIPIDLILYGEWFVLDL